MPTINLVPFLEELDRLVIRCQGYLDNTIGDGELIKQELEEALNSFIFLIQINNTQIICLHELRDNFLVYMRLIDRKTRHFTDNRLAICHPAETNSNGTRGRPKLLISVEVILSLKQLNFKQQQMANLLSVSRWTISRRIKELNISNECGFASIEDDQLDFLISTFQCNHGITAGRSLVHGHLLSLGLRIQQRRIKKSLVRVNPETSRLRFAAVINRRKYKVPAPNSLWHLDGHHSLIEYGFVVHGRQTKKGRSRGRVFHGGGVVEKGGYSIKRL